MSTIIPTIGRVVWYWPSKDDERMGHIPIKSTPAQPFEARVTFVWNESMVNLAITDHHGVPYGRTSVYLRQPDQDPLEGGGFCEWMPYQIGQAAKHV